MPSGTNATRRRVHVQPRHRNAISISPAFCALTGSYIICPLDHWQETRDYEYGATHLYPHTKLDPTAMMVHPLAVACCATLSLYHAVELLALIFATFKHYSGLYFWSLLVASAAIIPYSVGYVFMYFDVNVRFYRLRDGYRGLGIAEDSHPASLSQAMLKTDTQTRPGRFSDDEGFVRLAVNYTSRLELLFRLHPYRHV